MIHAFFELLGEQPVMLLFVVLGFGYLMGKIRILGFEPGPVSGVLLAGLVFGHFGYRVSDTVQSLGFILFIFSVGLQAGPRFFQVIRTDGAKYFCLALVIATSGFLVAMTMSRTFDFAPGSSAGILAGGLTSSPTLAAAQEAVARGEISVPEGFTAEEVMTNVTTAYAVTYIFGLVGLILIIRLLPASLGIDIAAEAKRLEEGDLAGERNRVLRPEEIAVRAYRVESERLIGKSLREIFEVSDLQITVLRIRRGDEVFAPNLETVIEKGDEVAVLAVLRGERREIRVGTEISDPEFTQYGPESVQIVVTKRAAVGRSVTDLNLLHEHACFLTEVRRQGVAVPITATLTLEMGDVMNVTGPGPSLDHLSEVIGHVERDVIETDLVTFSFGIVVGIFVGSLTVTLGGVPIGLGTAGGLLSAGLVIGFLRSVHPTFGRVPSAARWIFMELGLLIFMACVGLRAGGDIVDTLRTSGLPLFASGAAVTVIPVLAGYFFGRAILRLNPVLLLGGITGSMTSGASLSIVTKEAKSAVPALGYTGAYAFANVMLTVAGSLILRL